MERHQLARRIYGVTRQEQELRIELSNAKCVVLHDHEQQDDPTQVVQYSYRDHLSSIGYHVIAVQYWEGDAYLLVDERNGRRHFIDDVPVIAPDRRRLVTASDGGEAGYVPTRVEVWRVEPDTLVKEWSYAPKGCWVLSEPRWQGEDTIVFEASCASTPIENAVADEAVARFRDEAWRLETKLR